MVKLQNSTQGAYESHSGPDRWYIHDQNAHHGPMTWLELSQKVMAKDVSRKAYIKNETWPNWAPITSYFHPLQMRDPEAMGLIPSRYDAMFYAGMGLFMVGLLAMFIFLPLGLLMVSASTGIEIYAIVLERKNRPRSVTATLGNLMAGGWIIIQVLVTLFILMIEVGGL